MLLKNLDSRLELHFNEKKIYFIIFYFFPQYLLADDGIVYLDVQYIIDNSFLGIHYKKIKLIEDENKSIILNKKKLIKSKEQEINNQKIF